MQIRLRNWIEGNIYMKRILVVDDFRANVIMIQQALVGKYEVTTATSGREALQLLRGKPDLLILDINMPDMNGIEVLRKKQADNQIKDIPVVFLTGQADRDNIVEGFRLGIRDIIAKPIVIRTVEERIERVFDNIRKEQEMAKERELARQQAIIRGVNVGAEEQKSSIDDEYKELFDDDFWNDTDWGSMV